MHLSFETPVPTWPGIAGLKCHDLTSDESWQCRRCAGVLISRQMRQHVFAKFFMVFDCLYVQSTLVISNSNGLYEILRDIRTSTYQICRTEEKKKIIRTNTLYVIGLLKLEIYWKYCGKEEKLLLRSNFSSFPQYFLPVVRFSCLGRDQIFTLR